MTLKLMLVDQDTERAALLEEALLAAGYVVAAKLTEADDLLGHVKTVQPDVIIIDTDSPDRDTLEHICMVSRDEPRPVVMFTGAGGGTSITEALRAGVSAYVVDGLSAHRVKPIVELAIARFREHQALRTELEQAKTTLAQRKTIERAKGIVMQQRGFGEQEAYALMRKTAMDKNLGMIEVAEHIITAAELLT